MNKVRTTLKPTQLLRGVLSPLAFSIALLLCLNAQTTYGYSAEPIPGEVTASIMEQEDNYIVRLSLPGRDLKAVNMSLNGNRLHVEAPSEGNFGRYEQDLVLDQASANQHPRVDRREAEKTIVLTVPKGKSLPQQSAQITSQNNTSPQTDPFDAMTIGMAQEFQRMQKQMEQMMMVAFPQPGDILRTGLGAVGGDALSNINFEEQKDKYVVRANLPNPHLGKINVDIREQVLTIEAKEENAQQSKGNSAYFSEQSEYSQSMRLPGPVEIGKMKVDRAGDTLVITLPKASS